MGRWLQGFENLSKAEAHAGNSARAEREALWGRFAASERGDAALGRYWWLMSPRLGAVLAAGAAEPPAAPLSGAALAAALALAGAALSGAALAAMLSDEAALLFAPDWLQAARPRAARAPRLAAKIILRIWGSLPSNGEAYAKPTKLSKRTNRASPRTGSSMGSTFSRVRPASFSAKPRSSTSRQRPAWPHCASTCAC